MTLIHHDLINKRNNGFFWFLKNDFLYCMLKYNCLLIKCKLIFNFV